MTKESKGGADRRLLRQVVAQFRPYRGQVLVVALLILVTSDLGVVSPLLIKVVFDRALFVPGGPNIPLLVELVALMITVPVIASVVGVYQSSAAHQAVGDHGGQAPRHQPVAEHAGRVEAARDHAGPALEHRLDADAGHLGALHHGPALVAGGALSCPAASGSARLARIGQPEPGKRALQRS